MRTFSKTPSGFPTNLVFYCLIPDILKEINDGFDGIDAEGNEIKIFLVVCDFLGDNPASSPVMDVMKHSAGARCRHCTFRYFYKEGRPEYCYSTDIHSDNPAFARTVGLTLTLRDTGISASDLKILGMKEGHCSKIHELGAWILLNLSVQLRKI